MKKVIASALCLTMVGAAFAACSKDGGAKGESDKILNVWSFTDEVPNMILRYKELHPDFDYEINITNIPTTDQAYQPALDEALAAGGKDAPDIYCAEAAFIMKYSQGGAAGYALPYADLGIDVDKGIADAKIAQYTIDIGTRPSDGKLVALGYQATGGAFIYRRTVAKTVWGADDPATVAEKIGADTGSWDKFWQAAEECKSAGCAIVSGDGDVWHAVENSSSTGWVVDGKLTIPKEREEFLDISMKLKENNYHNDTQDWQEAWFADMKGLGQKDVLGFFGPAWLINYTIADNCTDEDSGVTTYGDWGVCNSPIGFFWGGTWVLVNKDTEHKEACKTLIEWITLDSSETGLQYMWANGTLYPDKNTKDAVASATVMAKSDGTVEFLGGQNMFDTFIPAGDYAKGDKLTEYDEKINGFWRDQVRAYTAGEKTREQAIEDFKVQVKENTTITVE
ncbi:MAG: ABC transporter substrate-binding protein [Clostridia bacterium]|nr:ABC transporter substrate-binding protein [Clostridia bacterium]